jgi:dTDP-4-dehydrorhamnose reductase
LNLLNNVKTCKKKPEISGKRWNPDPKLNDEISRQLVKLSGTDAYGLYHATAEGHCSWYEFAAEIFKLTGTKTRLNIADPYEFPSKVPRPKYSVLENANLKKEQLNIFRPWDAALKEYLMAGKFIRQ